MHAHACSHARMATLCPGWVIRHTRSCMHDVCVKGMHKCMHACTPTLLCACLCGRIRRTHTVTAMCTHPPLCNLERPERVSAYVRVRARGGGGQAHAHAHKHTHTCACVTGARASGCPPHHHTHVHARAHTHTHTHTHWHACSWLCDGCGGAHPRQAPTQTRTYMYAHTCVPARINTHADGCAACPPVQAPAFCSAMGAARWWSVRGSRGSPARCWAWP